MKVHTMLAISVRRFLSIAALILLAHSASALNKISDTPLSSDRLYLATSNGYVVYLDQTGRLYSAKTDGTDRKNISLQKVDEAETDRLLVIAKQPSEFVIVDAPGTSQVVYFQARENPRSFRLFLYKVDVAGSIPPVKLFQLVKPLKQIKLSPDKKSLYLSGDDKHSVLDIASGAKQDLTINPFPAAPFRISNDFKSVAYVVEYRTASDRNFELHLLDIVSGQSHTLLQGLDNYDFKFEFSSDSASIAVQELIKSEEHLVSVSIDGNDVTQIFPLPGEPLKQRIGEIFAMAGIRGPGDTGAFIFSATDEHQIKKIYMADLLDLYPRQLETREGLGETVKQFRISPDSKTLVFQRDNIADIPAMNHARTYSLNLMDPAARPVFLFENDYLHSEFLNNGLAMVFVSSGGFYARNQIVEVSLDGVTSRVLSANFPPDWITAEEQITRLGVGFGKTLFVSVFDPKANPAKYSLLSFESN